MVNLKKAALAVIALGVTSVASAGMYAPPAAAGCTGSSVTVPCEKQGWSFAADALYVQTNNVGQVSSTTTTSGTAVTTAYQNLQPNWVWGFRFAAGYDFGTGNDLNVNWTHFVKQSSQTTAGAGVDGMYTVNALQGDNTADSIATDIDNTFNAVNFEFGQTVNFGEHVDTRFHAGLQYAQIKNTLDQSAWNASNVAIYNENTMESKFDGIGPRLGMDSSYSFGNGLSIFGNVAGSLLVGDLKYNENGVQTDANGTGTTAASTTVTATADNSIVPEMDAKLGLSYTKPLAQGDLSAEVGYEVANYWNSTSYTSSAADADKTDFGYDGIFFGLKWLGNV